MLWRSKAGSTHCTLKASSQIAGSAHQGMASMGLCFGKLSGCRQPAQASVSGPRCLMLRRFSCVDGQTLCLRKKGRKATYPISECCIHEAFVRFPTTTTQLPRVGPYHAQGKTGGNALDRIGGGGHMKAAGGGSNLDDQMQGGSGRRMQFTSGRG